ncbi:hypothetical protein GCK72_021625 [Caenorhabditis remanei]|uniref:Uncharacterized protein n=1 Tax=Caenorhabditis remanei TaxID=31234 RepID=A0A6A5GIN5_CAERE|nr:hypothetical protein GCK72_021625 [Caenorhabditis remanei]KAF1755057.1 hypothetical protein GCK72_021625 [Caenorhabditis remanei]
MTSDYYKYPIRVNVELKPANYQGLYHTTFQIPSIAGFHDSEIGVYLTRHGDSCVVSAKIRLGGSKEALVRTRCCVEVVNRDEEENEFIEKECALELGKECKLMDSFFLLDIFDEKDGWINNGELKLKFGIYAYAIYEQNIWFFNFNDSIFDAKDAQQSILLLKKNSDENIECNKQVGIF